MDPAGRFLLAFGPAGSRPGLVWGGAYRRCRRLPRRCRPCSQRPHRSASAGGCSAHSCTGTGPCHSGACSPSAGGERASWSDPGTPAALSGSPLLVSLPTSSEPSAQSWSPSHFQRPAMQRPLAQENSLSEQGRGAGEGRDRPLEGWAWHPALEGTSSPRQSNPTPCCAPEAAADWHDGQNAPPTPCSHWLSSGGTHSPLGHPQEGGTGPSPARGTHCVGGREGRDKTTTTSTRV